MTEALGLRERKKAAARQALHEAALRLAIERGLDHVTTEAIADAAGLSRRTFSNYFTGKEEAILYSDQRELSRLIELVRARPADESGWMAFRQGVRDLSRESDDLERGELVAVRRLRQHPALVARKAAAYSALEQQVAAAITGRDTGPVAPRVLAAALLAGLRLGTQLWLEGPADESLSASTEKALDQFSQPFC